METSLMPAYLRRAYVAAIRTVRKGAALLFDLDRRPVGRFALWLRSLLSIYDSADLARLDLTWWTFSATDHVDGFVAGRGGRVNVFEYGSGASTVWLARRCADVRTVEHDADFAATMAPIFANAGNIHMQLIPSTDLSAGEIERSRRRGYENRSFSRYVRSIDGHAGLFDIIVIDGRSRVHCLDKARRRLAPGGIIVFDNSNRREYRSAIDRAGLRERVMRGMTPALPYPSQTSILS